MNIPPKVRQKTNGGMFNVHGLYNKDAYLKKRTELGVPKELKLKK